MQTKCLMNLVYSIQQNHSMRYATVFLAFALCAAAQDREPKRFFQMTEAEIAATLKDLHDHNPSLQTRIEALSELFIGTPYRLGPLGEGDGGEFDREPLVGFKEADCTTLVEQVTALSLKPDLEDAIRTLQRIRYRKGKISYKERNHFPEIDWVPNNIAAGYVKDITRDAAGDKTATARKLISKKNWYANKTLDDIQGFAQASVEEKQKRLERLKTLGKGFKDENASVPYAPIDIIPEILEKIPSGTIANVVREDKPDIPVLISHQVLIITKDNAQYVRHASSSGKMVEDVLLRDYLSRYAASSWKLLGLNLNQV